MPIQTFALSSGKVPAAKPMHTGTLGKQDGQASTEAISKIPRPAAAGAGFLAGRGVLLRIWAASARANGWPGRGEKSVTMATAGLALTAALPTSAGRGSAA